MLSSHRHPEILQSIHNAQWKRQRPYCDWKWAGWLLIGFQKNNYRKLGVTERSDEWKDLLERAQSMKILRIKLNKHQETSPKGKTLKDQVDKVSSYGRLAAFFFRKPGICSVGTEILGHQE